MELDPAFFEQAKTPGSHLLPPLARYDEALEHFREVPTLT